MTKSSSFFDELETRDPAMREAALMAALPKQIAHAKANTQAYAKILADVDPDSVIDRAALARLPVTRKSDFITLQSEAPPLGGFNAIAVGTGARICVSPGPIFELEAARSDYWGCARARYAAGFRKREIGTIHSPTI